MADLRMSQCQWPDCPYVAVWNFESNDGRLHYSCEDHATSYQNLLEFERAEPDPDRKAPQINPIRVIRRLIWMEHSADLSVQ